MLEPFTLDSVSWARATQTAVASPPMTIIASLRHDDSVFLAADGQVTDRATRYPEKRTKLEFVSAPPLAWGFAGDDGIGGDFGRWLQQDGLPARDWWTLRDRAVEELARLNGRQRELLRLSRVTEEAEGDTVSVLLAGFLGGVLEVLELDDRGGHAFHGKTPGSFMAIGSGALHARIVHGITRELNPSLTGEALMRFVLQRAIPIAEMCGFPARVLRVSASSASHAAGVEERPDVRHTDDT